MTLSPREYVHIEINVDVTCEPDVMDAIREKLTEIDNVLKERNYKPFVEIVVHTPFGNRKRQL